jgi:hypothetical protein
VHKTTPTIIIIIIIIIISVRAFSPKQDRVVFLRLPCNSSTVLLWAF